MRAASNLGRDPGAHRAVVVLGVHQVYRARGEKDTVLWYHQAGAPIGQRWLPSFCNNCQDRTCVPQSQLPTTLIGELVLGSLMTPMRPAPVALLLQRGHLSFVPSCPTAVGLDLTTPDRSATIWSTPQILPWPLRYGGRICIHTRVSAEGSLVLARRLSSAFLIVRERG